MNLFLHILGRRGDGYHELQTLFQFLDYSDGLAYRVRADGRIGRVFGAPDVAGDEDLVVRAARALQRHAGVEQGVDIALTKRLPLGGGLGGGSSDAATTLVALNHLWGCGLYPDALADLGASLGADVPVFIRGRAAWGEGVGERLTPVDVRTPWYLVLVPPVQVSTRALFADPELTRDHPPITIRDFLSGAGGNDFEGPARRRFPEIAAAMDWLESHGAPARLSGSGASVFAALTDEASARSLRRQAPREWRAFTAPGRNESPLATRIAALTQ